MATLSPVNCRSANQIPNGAPAANPYTTDDAVKTDWKSYSLPINSNTHTQQVRIGAPLSVCLSHAHTHQFFPNIHDCNQLLMCDATATVNTNVVQIQNGPYASGLSLINAKKFSSRLQ